MLNSSFSPPSSVVVDDVSPPEGVITGSLDSLELSVQAPNPNTKTHSRQNFIENAKKSGASCSLVERVDDQIGMPQLVVSDSLESFQQIARSVRDHFKGKVVGVTGSSGKTSTKDMLSILLGKGDTLSTKGNLNNHLGIPLTLVQIDSAQHKWAVIEAGINQVGEMQGHSRMILNACQEN